VNGEIPKKDRIVYVRFDDELYDWLRSIARRDSTTVSSIVRNAVRLAKDIVDGKYALVERSANEFYLSDDTVKLLRDIADMSGVDDTNYLLELIVTAFHVLLRVGIWQLLKPVPELAKLILQQESTDIRDEHAHTDRGEDEAS